MNELKLQRAKDGLTGITKTVLDAVPIAGPWSANQIAGELRRSGRCIEPKAVLGCLDSLRGIGLVKEPERGMFIQVVAKPKDSKVQETKQEAKPLAEKNPIDLLAEISSRLRKEADEIDAIALQVAGQIEQVSGDTKKLRQLQDILKSIGAA